MRITQQMMSNQFIQSYQKSVEATGKLQQQIASSKRIEKPSDDPYGTVQSLSYQSTLNEIDQYQKNAQDGITMAEATDTAIGQVTSILQRVRELTVQGSTDSYSDADRKNMATEIKSLQQELGNVANTTLGNRYLFSGTDNTAPYQNGALQSSNQEGVQWNIGKGVSVTANVTAPALFGNVADGKNLFDTVNSVAQTLDNGGNPNSIIATIDKQLDNVSTQRAIVGTKQNLLESASSQLDQTSITTQKMLSNIADVDVAKAYTDLSSQEAVMKAALSAGAKIIQPSLVDFLR
ncbi:flagellar hook-associated protein FlgL [Ectobacillus sp. sgz5001026]|uniref:flagellar hook-associated protein FlgL n=1 Tax=Ectobacillus sp. sgz5001026 TaxID=3242473 RepID=UPI0036D2B52D